MNELKIFENPQFGEIRTSGTSERPLFCLSDVCKALGLGNVTEVKKRLSPPFISTIEVGVRTGKKSDGSPAIQQTQMIFIGEPNLYKCIFQSRKKEAEAFQDWVCGEVLPSIRKTGGYLATTPDDTPEMIMAKALKVADATMRRQDTELKAAKGTLAAIKEAIRESTAALEKANRLLYGEPEEAKAEPKEAEPVEKRREFAPEISLIDPDEYRGYRWRYDGLWGAYDLLVKFAHKSYFHVDDFFDTLVRAGYAIETSYVGGDCKRRRCYRLTEEGKRWGRNKLFHATGKSLPIFYHDRFERFLDELKRKGFKI
jgi:prophage antirepressor-like protein